MVCNLSLLKERVDLLKFQTQAEPDMLVFHLPNSSPCWVSISGFFVDPETLEPWNVGLQNWIICN